MHPLLQNFSPSQTTPKNFDVLSNKKNCNGFLRKGASLTVGSGSPLLFPSASIRALAKVARGAMMQPELWALKIQILSTQVVSYFLE